MRTTLASLAVLALCGTAIAFQGAAQSSAPTGDAQVIAQQLPSYPLDTCPVSKEPLDAMGKPLNLVHEGRLVRLCCKGCTKEFQKDPAATLKTIDEAVVKAQKASYPLAKCPVSSEELGGMGEPLDFVNGTRLVRFCCKGCVKEFQKDPAKYMAQVDAALIDAQMKTYPLKACVVDDKALEGGVDQLYGTRLVRFCSAGCAAEFQKDPAKYLGKLGETPKKPQEAGTGKSQ